MGMDAYENFHPHAGRAIDTQKTAMANQAGQNHSRHALALAF